jgi:Protein of unknown function (DUF1559)
MRRLLLACVPMVLLAAVFTVRPIAVVQAQAPSEAPLPPDLASVPAESIGFVHVRVRDGYMHSSMDESRAQWKKAGARAFEELTTQFAPDVSTFDRMTVAFLPARNPAQGIIAIAKFTEPFDLKAIQSTYFPKGKLLPNTAKPMIVDEDESMAILIPEPSTMILGAPETLAKLSKPMKGNHPMQAELKEASSGKKLMYATAELEKLPIPPDALEQIPTKIQPIAGFRTVTLSLELGQESTFDLRLRYPNAEAATKAEKAMIDGTEMARKFLNDQRAQPEDIIFKKKPKEGYRKIDELPEFLMALGQLASMNAMDEFLAKPPIVKQDTDLSMQLKTPAWMTQYLAATAIGAGLALPAVQKVRESAAIAQSSNNMKQIMLAMHNYHDVNGFFPPAAIVDKKGKPLLSWRVAILPFIEQDNLYRQFKLDEPWDSEHNLKWSEVAIKTYTDPRLPVKPGMTYYKAFVGPDGGLTKLKGRRIADITDGSSNTIAFVAAGEPVIWSKPEDFEFDKKKPAPDITKPFPKVLAAFMDGSVRTLNMEKVGRGDTLKNLIMANDGNVIDID